MSILIKGMEMPSECRMCRFSYFKIGTSMKCLILNENCARYRRLSNCPLVEIPSKHGDLIDRDSLQKQSHVIEEYHPELQRQGMPKKVIYIEDVEKAPTIIEAEG